MYVLQSKRLPVVLAGLSMSTAGLKSSLAESVYNVNDSFLADVTDPNAPSSSIYGNYQYGYSTTSGSSLSGFTAFQSSERTYDFVDRSGNGFDTGLDGFNIGTLEDVPAVVVNATGADFSTDFGATVEKGQLLLHPGGLLTTTSNSAFYGPYASADVRFVVPAKGGKYSIVADFSQLDTHGNTDDGVYVNGNLVTTIENSSSKPDFSFITTDLKAGSTIDFVAAVGPNGIGYASTGLFANVAAVPLPPAAYSAVGLLAVIAAGSKLRRRGMSIAT